MNPHIFVCAWLEPSKIKGCKCCKNSSKTTWAHVFFPKQCVQRSTYRVYAPDLPPKMAVKNGPSQSFWVYIQSKTDPWSTRHPNTFLDPQNILTVKHQTSWGMTGYSDGFFVAKGNFGYSWEGICYSGGMCWCISRGTFIKGYPTFPFDCCKPPKYTYVPWNTKPHEVWLDIPMDLIVANVRYRKEFLSCSGSVALLLLCRVGSADRNFVDSRLMGDGRGAQRCSCFRTGGAFKYVLFLFLLKGMIQFDSCFSSGLKSPPIYFVWQKMTPDSHHQQMDRSMIWVKNCTQKRGTYKSASFFSRWWFLKYVLFSPLLGEDEPNLTYINIFQRGWFNHQPFFLFGQWTNPDLFTAFATFEAQEALPMLEASTKDPYQQLDVTTHRLFDLGPPEGRFRKRNSPYFQGNKGGWNILIKGQMDGIAQSAFFNHPQPRL